jgi:hypothetical protein
VSEWVLLGPHTAAWASVGGARCAVVAAQLPSPPWSLRCKLEHRLHVWASADCGCGPREHVLHLLCSGRCSWPVWYCGGVHPSLGCNPSREGKGWDKGREGAAAYPAGRCARHQHTVCLTCMGCLHTGAIAAARERGAPGGLTRALLAAEGPLLGPAGCHQSTKCHLTVQTQAPGG